MRRRLDVKFLACLLLAVAVLAGCVHIIHGYQMTHNARVLLHYVDEAEAQQNFDRASVYLHLYLGYVPGDGDAFVRYAFLLRKQARTESQENRAFVTLERALTRKPNRHDVRRELIPMAMKRARYTEAEQHLRFLLEPANKAFPHDAQLERLLAQCYQARKDYTRADEQFQLAIQDAPAELDVYAEYARLLRRQPGKTDKADEVMSGMIAANPKSAAAYLIRARYRQEVGKAAEGRKDVARAYELGPDDADVLQAMARLYLEPEHKDFEKARGYLRHCLDLHPQNAASYLALAELEVQAKRRDEALACLSRGLKAVPRSGHGRLLWAQANLLAETDAGMDEALTSLRQSGFPAAQVEFVRARAAVTCGDWLAASSALEALRPDLQRWPQLVRETDLLLGQCYAQLGDPDRQYVAYRRAAADDPDDAAAFGVASSLLALGKLDEALSAFRTLALKRPEVRPQFARLLILQNLQLPQAQRVWGEVDRLLDEAEKDDPDAVTLPLLRADALAGKGRTAEARALLTAARDKRPKEAQYWVALATLEERDGKPGAVLPVLDEAQRRLGDRVELRLVRARYWAKRGGEGGRRELAKLAENRGGFDPAEQDRLLRGLADSFTLAGDTAGARRLWGELARLHPEDLGIKAMLFDLALQAEDGPAMSQAVDDIRNVEEGRASARKGDGTLWRYGRVCYLIWQNSKRKANNQAPDEAQVREAQAKLTAITQLRPAWSRLAVSAAQIDLLRGNRPGAIRNYERAVNELGNRSPEAIRQLVLLLYEYHRYAETELVLRKLPEEQPLSPDLVRVAAELSFQNHDYDQAVALAEKAVSEPSKDYRDCIWLGVILSRKPERQADAERALRQAIALAGDIPDTWVALVRYLVSRGEKDRAVAEIRQAEAKLSRDQARLALAPCYEAIGSMGRAQELYEAAVAARPDDPAARRRLASYYLRKGRSQDAEPQLQKLIDLTAKSSPDEARQARRTLALILIARGGAERSREALALLTPDTSERPGAAAAPEDQRARALVLARQGARKQRREAIALLENLMEQEPPTADDRLLLAQLYEAEGSWAQARQQMSVLLGGQDQKPVYIASFAHALLRHGEYEAVRPWLEKLEQSPETRGTFTPAEIKARLFAARGQHADAAAVVTEYVASREAKPDDVAARRRLAAVLLDRMSQTFPAEKAYAAGAEAMYREWVRQQPEQVGSLAALLGRQGRVGEALDLCERAGSAVPVEVTGNAFLQALAAGQAGPEHYRRVERWLEAAVARSQNPPALLVCQACVLGLEGRHQDEEALYRRVLERDARSVIALNNLAALLALQGRGGEAQGLIQRAVEIDGPKPELRDTRAVVRLSLGQGELAVEDLNEALLQEQAAVYYFHLAQACAAVQKPEEARDSLRKAREAGFQAQDLSALERPAYEQLVAKLGGK
jgi:tetratricopeptide (TPR) repeat protein